MSNQRQDDVAPSYHKEGDAIVFDRPVEQEQAARQRREDEQHEFARSQVRTNKKLAWFTGALMVATFCTIGIGIWQAAIYRAQLNAMQGQLDEMRRSGAAATDQTWQAIGNINWMARSMDMSQKVAQRSIESGERQSKTALNASIENMHQEQRAWVGIADVKPLGYTPDVAAHSASMTVAFTLRNYGRSAAEHVRFLAELESDPTVFSLSCDEVAIKNRGGDVLLPTQVHTLNWVMNLTYTQMEKGWAHQNPQLGHNLILRIVGCIEYSDRDREVPPHRTPFTYVVWTKGFITPDKPIPGEDLFLDSFGPDSSQTH